MGARAFFVIGVTICALACVLPAAAGADGWQRTGSLATKRSDSTATVLPNGHVLVTGGFDTDPAHPFSSVEAYDPLTGHWSARASMSTAREDAVAALLTDGRVLVAGGSDGTHSLKSAEIYDPATNTWTSTPDMAARRSSAMGQILADGRVMVAGGYDDLGGGTLKTVDIYNPGTNSWDSTGQMGSTRQIAGIALLPSGEVLVAGGISDPSTAETWDPAVNLWTPTTNNMSTPRQNSPFALTLMANGAPLFAGGGLPPLAGTDVYDPGTRKWSAVGSLATARQYANALLLRNGRVLAVGGLKNNGGPTSLAVADTAELFNGATGKWSPAAKPVVPLEGNPAVALCDGRVLLAGGTEKYTGSFNATNAAELYTPTLPHPLNGELLVNGNAETGPGAGASGVFSPPGWVTTPNFTQGAYDPSFFASPPGGGRNFFAGGPATPSSKACQSVSVTQAAARIDSGFASVTLAADLGGFDVQSDRAGVIARFRSARGAVLAQTLLPPVTEAQRGGVTKLIHRTATRKVPAGARSIEVVIFTLRDTSGSYDDGYADNVSLKLKSTPVPLPKLSKLKVKPKSFTTKSGTTISYNDSLPGRVKFVVRRKADGKKVGSFSRAAQKGNNVFHFDGKVGGKKLKPDDYRLTAVPRNLAGKTGKSARRSFSVTG